MGFLLIPQQGPFVMGTIYSNKEYQLIRQEGDQLIMPINSRFLMYALYDYHLQHSPLDSRSHFISIILKIICEVKTLGSTSQATPDKKLLKVT